MGKQIPLFLLLLVINMRYVILTILLIGCSTPPKIQYDGDLNDDGKWHGNGTLKFPDGSSYSGEWKNNKMHGKGVFLFLDSTSVRVE